MYHQRRLSEAAASCDHHRVRQTRSCSLSASSTDDVVGWSASYSNNYSITENTYCQWNSKINTVHSVLSQFNVLETVQHHCYCNNTHFEITASCDEPTTMREQNASVRCRPHTSVIFSRHTENDAVNVVPNFTFFDQLFAEISHNEFYWQVFGPPCNKKA